MGSCKSAKDCICLMMGNPHNYMLVPFHMHFPYMEEFSRVVIFRWEQSRQNRYVLESLGKLCQNTHALEILKDHWGRNSHLYLKCTSQVSEVPPRLCSRGSGVTLLKSCQLKPPKFGSTKDTVCNSAVACAPLMSQTWWMCNIFLIQLLYFQSHWCALH